MMTKVFLALVGIMYLGLALWCTIAPTVTSGKVGFELKPGSGQSEFLVIYGGLELALAIVFLLPIANDQFTFSSLMTCLILHGCLVLFRTASFFMYTDFERITFNLAIGEWIIFVISIVCWFTQQPPQS